MMNFRSSVMLFAGMVFSFQSFAQKAPENWQNLDFKNDGVYGVSSDKAYNEFLKEKKSETIIVAVIDSGTDVDHDDLKGVLWTNKKEIAGNGIDDDGNGYIDDVHGWNFIGGKDYDVLEETLELTRLYAKYTKQFEGKDVSKLSRKEKKEYKKYQEIKIAFEKEQKDTQTSLDGFNAMINSVLRNYYLISSYLDNKSFKLNDMAVITTQDSIIQQSKVGIEMIMRGDTSVTADLILAQVEMQKEKVSDYFGEKLEFNLNPEWAPRADKNYDESDFTNFNYGNNHYLSGGADNGHGTHCAGIIGAERGNNLGIEGVAGNVEIMTIRAVPNGDEHDRDIAAAMRYAVDNGARVISMSYGKSFSYNKEGVDKAIAYGVKKGVLFVHAAGNDSKNIDDLDNFPNVKNSRRSGKSWIEVGASSWKTGEFLPATFSNYGKKTVDLFAPGVDIYSSVPMNSYDTYSGTSMACPAVAGVAALVMSYYPELSGKDVKKILMKSVTDLSDVEVVLPGNEKEDKKVKFGELSKTGGIVNAYEALKLAEKMSK